MLYELERGSDMKNTFLSVLLVAVFAALLAVPAKGQLTTGTMSQSEFNTFYTSGSATGFEATIFPTGPNFNEFGIGAPNVPSGYTDVNFDYSWNVPYSFSITRSVSADFVMTIGGTSTQIYNSTSPFNQLVIATINDWPFSSTTLTGVKVNGVSVGDLTAGPGNTFQSITVDIASENFSSITGTMIQGWNGSGIPASGNQFSDVFTAREVVPEPSVMLLLVPAFVGYLTLRRRKK